MEEKRKDWLSILPIILSVVTIIILIFSGIFKLGEMNATVTNIQKTVENDIKPNIETLEDEITKPGGLSERITRLEENTKTLAENIGEIERNIENIENLLNNQILPRIQMITTKMELEEVMIGLQTDLEDARGDIRGLKAEQESVDRFLKKFSRELRQSVNSSLTELRAYIETLEGEELTAPQEDYLASLRYEFENLQKAIDELFRDIEALRQKVFPVLQ